MKEIFRLNFVGSNGSLIIRHTKCKMSFSIVIHKTFISPLSKEEVFTFVYDKLNSQSKFLFFSSNDYGGHVDENYFKFYKKFNENSGPAYPKIIGTIKSEYPTTIEIKIKPHYFRIAFFLIFPLVFIPNSLINYQMIINCTLRTPELYERILFALFGGGLPLLWCYFDCIRPIKKTEAWLRKELQLSEIKPPGN